jgi:hypothetical protein
MVGGAAVVVASFLPWFTANFGIGPFNRNGFQSWDSEQLNLDGVVTVVLGVLTGLVAVLRAGNWTGVPRNFSRVLARLPIVTAGAVGVLLSYRIPALDALAKEVSASYAGISAKVGYGIWLMAAGVVCAATGGFVVDERHRDIAHAALALAGGSLIAGSSVMPWFTVDLGAGHFARNGFQLGKELGVSVDGIIAVIVGVASIAVGVRVLHKSKFPMRWARGPLALGLIALVLVANQLPSLEFLGTYVTSLYGGGSAGPGFGLGVLVAGSGLAIVGGVVARGPAGGLGTDEIFVGGLLISAAGFLPWFTVDAGLVLSNQTGFELGVNSGWSTDGVIVVIAGSVIMASRVGVLRRGHLGQKSVFWLPIVGVLVVCVLLAYRFPLLYRRAHTIKMFTGGQDSAHVAYGIWVIIVGGAIVMFGCARRFREKVVGSLGGGVPENECNGSFRRE